MVRIQPGVFFLVGQSEDKSLKINVATISIVVAVLAAVAAGGYWYWTTTPLFALQETMLAAQNHDATTFQKRVWVASVVDNLLEDVIVYPALSTPNLSEFQRQVAAGAVTMVKIQTSRDIVNAINKNLASPIPYGDSHYQTAPQGPQSVLPPSLLSPFFLSPSISPPPCAPLLMQPAYAQPANIPAETKATPRDLLNVVSRELGGEVNKLKSEAYQRMQTYVRTHPQTVPGRIANATASERGFVLRRILADHGISENYFKGLTGYKVRDMSGREDELRQTNANASFVMSGPFEVAYVGVRFFSPTIDNEIVVEIELVKSNGPAGQAGSRGFEGASADTSNEWRIRRISNVRTVLNTVAQDYLTDVHELIAYSLAGMNNRNMASDMRGVTERIKQDPKARNVLQKLGF